MESVASFYKIENDIVYKVGEKNGLEMGNTAFVKYLLTETDYSVEKIAQKANVSVDFVEKVQASLAKTSN